MQTSGFTFFKAMNVQLRQQLRQEQERSDYEIRLWTRLEDTKTTNSDAEGTLDSEAKLHHLRLMEGRFMTHK
jgi:hypothetical protein